jgi:methylenetetrahydrofolate reductase (NADPH)
MSEKGSNGYKSGSRLERVLRAGHFAVTAELGPPQSADGEVIRSKAQLLKGV